jgi:O-antigen biosynthesis protein
MLSPHTGYPVLEMAACGMAVVTNTFGAKTSERLRELSANVIAATPTVESVTEALVRAADDVRTRERSSDLRLPGTWEEVFAPRIDRVVAMIDDCREAHS